MLVDGESGLAVERYAERGDPVGVPTIRELIRAALDAGKTVRQLEADSGDRVRFQTFQELSNNAPKQFPKQADTITGMAAALNISESTVVLAYATALGIPVETGSTFALRLPPGVDHLEPAMQDAILQVTRAALQSVGARRRVVVDPAVSEDEGKKFPWGRDVGVFEPGEAAGEGRQNHGQ
jgi:hypothetical protein